MNKPPLRKHREVMEDWLPLDGKRAADIGCGDGSLVRAMTRAGARVTGIDPSEGMLARARAAESVGNEDYLLGFAEDLPLPGASLDAAVFFNSLHHVPIERQAEALSEAVRVLKPGGLLYIVEPIADGRFFEIMRPIEDETEVRAKAYEALSAAAESAAFGEEQEFFYLTPVRYDDFAQFRDRAIAVDERRRPAVEAQEESLRQSFEAAAERQNGAYTFEQPCRLNLLHKR